MQRFREARRAGTTNVLAYAIVLMTACSLLGTGMSQGLASGQRSSTPLSQDSKTLRAPDAPTAASISRFDALYFNNEISLEWQSGYEVDNLGYNIYREQKGSRVQLNPSLIAGSALQVGQGVVLRAGNSYAWRDKFSESRLSSISFWLESINLNGQSTWHGPIYAKQGDRSLPRPTPSKLLTDYSVEPAATQMREFPAWISSLAPGRNAALNKPVVSSRIVGSTELDQQWAIAAQVCVKLSVSRPGWQRVGRAELLSAGLDPGASLANLQLYTGGVEQAIVVNGDGSVEFYGNSLNTLSTDTRLYYLIAGATPGKRVVVSSGGPFDPSVSPASFASTIERKDRTIRFAALLNGASENFFGPVISASPMRQTLQVSSLDQTSVTGGQLEVGVQGLTFQSHQVRVQINGEDVGFINLDGRDNATAMFAVTVAQLRENKNAVTLTSMLPGADVSLIDFVRLTYPRRYQAASNRLTFSVPGGQPVKATGFTTNSLRVLDITDESNVKELAVSPQLGSDGFEFTLLPNAQPRTIFATSGGSLDHPQQIRRNEPSSWHLATNAADLVIITHENFRQSLAPLRTLRESQGLTVAVMDVEDVFDEFSFGTHAPQALKDLLLRATDEWQVIPRYVLLVGDATSDPRDYLGQGSSDLVPTMMVDATFSEAPSDDAMVDFNGDGLPEMAVGRFPVTTPQQAALIVSKVLLYDQAVLGDTKLRGAVMVSDQPDGYDFFAFTLQVRTELPMDMNVQFINRTDGTTEVIRGQIMSAINKGPGIVNYLGHGSVGVWTGAPLLSVEDTANFTNANRLSIFVMMTCLNGSFTEVGTDSLAEAIIKAPNGGGVAVWASSGLTIPYGQVSISQSFYHLLFNGLVPRLGDATKQAKAATNDMDVRRLSILFGDPSMRFR